MRLEFENGMTIEDPDDAAPRDARDLAGGTPAPPGTP